jgi:hypothetical protein
VWATAMAVKMAPKDPHAGEDFGLGVPDGGGLEYGGRKAVEGKGEESAGVAAEAAGDIPQRSAEEDAQGEKRNTREPAPVRRFGSVEGWGPREERGGGHEREQWRMLGVEAGIVAGDIDRKRAGSVGEGRAGNSGTVDLPPAGCDANLLGRA